MWYFAWIFGLPLAAAVAMLNAMWLELMDDKAPRKKLLAKAGQCDEGRATSGVIGAVAACLHRKSWGFL